MRGLVVTGTDTGVGKTFVACLLVRFLRAQGWEAGYLKLVSTGAPRSEDLAFALAAAGLAQDPALERTLAPYSFPLPASPHLAAEQAGATIEPARLHAALAAAGRLFPFLVAEGAGGCLVPLTRDLLLADFLAETGLPALVVARTGLGTINHSLLTVEALRRRQVPILGLVFSDGPSAPDALLAEDNPRTVAAFAQVPVLGRLPPCPAQAAADQAFAPIGQRILQALGSER
ncbi:MAG: dethiobiotin synthase [Thermodesulfobacteriota bacterium]